MKYGMRILAILALPLLSACAPMESTYNPNSAAVANAQTCTTNSTGQLVTSTGAACGTTTNTCAAQGMTYNSATGACVAITTPVGGGTTTVGGGTTTVGGGTTTIGGGTGYGGGGSLQFNCDYWNQVYAGIGYYVPMNTAYGLYCVNIQSWVPDYEDYYTSGTTIVASQCPYGDSYSCQNYSWDDSSGGTCIGIGGNMGGEYGISGFFGVCF